jgi:uncharacterized protein
MKLWDGLRNLVGSIGTARDKQSAYTWVHQPMAKPDIDAIYLDDWIGRKIIDVPVIDMVREWRSWNGEQAEQLYEVEESFGVMPAVRDALCWARLYGGSAILIGDGSADPLQPLDVSRIARGGLAYITAFSRHDISSDGDVILDPASPAYGRPERYRINDTNALVHRSRFVLFDGDAVPRDVRRINQGWGMPLYQGVRTAVLHAQATAANAAALTDEAKIDVIKVPDLQNHLADAESERRLKERFALAAMMKSTVNTLLLGGDEEFSSKTTSFTGLPELMRQHLQAVAGAADVPLIRLLGQAPSGLQSTGDNEMRAYYDAVRAKQKAFLTPALRRLDTAMMMHAFGRVPEDVDHDWTPLWQMLPVERADIAKKKAETTQVYVNAGLFPADGLAKATRDQIIADGVYPSFDQHVAEADIAATVAATEAENEAERLAREAMQQAQS